MEKGLPGLSFLQFMHRLESDDVGEFAEMTVDPQAYRFILFAEPAGPQSQSFRRPLRAAELDPGTVGRIFFEARLLLAQCRSSFHYGY